MKNRKKVIKFKKNSHINIGLIITILIVFYIGYYLVSYLKKPNISVYEVKKGSIAKNNHYEAVAIRDECIVTADRDGYIFYYLKNGSRVGVNSKIYAIDSSGEVYNKIKNFDKNDKEFSNYDLSQFENITSQYMDGYNSNDFNKIYAYATEIKDQIQSIHIDRVESKLNDYILNAQNKGIYNIYYPKNTGYVIFSLDGYEGTTEDNFMEIKSKQVKRDKNDIRTEQKIKKNAPVYKIINSSEWKIAMKISNEVYKEIKNRKYISVKFDYDSSKSIGKVKIIHRNNDKYLILSFNDSMERFSESRFIPVELELNYKSGLKIPNSAITTKSFYKIPKDYFLKGNNSNDLGVIIRKNGGEKFITPEIYYSTKKYYYIAVDEMEQYKTIAIPHSTDKYYLNTRKESKYGVYNINKGFADFRIIDILYKTNDYSIIDDYSSYGVMLYDHIALDSNTVSNGKTIY